MLHLLNYSVMNRESWQLLDAMLSTDDHLILYEQAVMMLVPNHPSISELLQWADRGIKLYVLQEDCSKNNLDLDQLCKTVFNLVDYAGFVGLVADNPKVQSL